MDTDHNMGLCVRFRNVWSTRMTADSPSASRHPESSKSSLSAFNYGL